MRRWRWSFELNFEAWFLTALEWCSWRWRGEGNSTFTSEARLVNVCSTLIALAWVDNSRFGSSHRSTDLSWVAPRSFSVLVNCDVFWLSRSKPNLKSKMSVSPRSTSSTVLQASTSRVAACSAADGLLLASFISKLNPFDELLLMVSVRYFIIKKGKCRIQSRCFNLRKRVEKALLVAEKATSG